METRTYNMQTGSPGKLPQRLIILGVIVVIIIVALFKSTVIVRAGEGGVLFKTLGEGVYTGETFGEGFHIIAPWNKMVVYNSRQQELLESMAVLSSNGLEIKLDVSLWFQPDYKKLPFLYKEKGYGYVDQVVRPAVRSASRSVIGRYTPEQIYSTKRDAIQSEIYEETKKMLSGQYVQLNQVLIRDITLPPTIKQAIEKKLKQEQESLEYEFKLEKQKKEAERLRIEAEGKARANEILNASLTSNVLKEKGIEATMELANSPNAKVVIVGNSDGLPLILGNQ